MRAPYKLGHFCSRSTKSEREMAFWRPSHKPATVKAVFYCYFLLLRCLSALNEHSVEALWAIDILELIEFSLSTMILLNNLRVMTLRPPHDASVGVAKCSWFLMKSIWSIRLLTVPNSGLLTYIPSSLSYLPVSMVTEVSKRKVEVEYIVWVILIFRFGG